MPYNICTFCIVSAIVQCSMTCVGLLVHTSIAMHGGCVSRLFLSLVNVLRCTYHMHNGVQWKSLINYEGTFYSYNGNPL